MTRTILSLFCCCFALVAIVGCGGGGGPQGVFADYKAAMKSGDQAAMLKCMKPADQKVMIKATVMGAWAKSMQMEDEAAKEELKKALDAGGFKAEGDQDAMFAGVKDWMALYNATGDWMKKHFAKEVEASTKKAPEGSDATLKDVKIEGTNATGTMVVTEKDKDPVEQPMKFVQVDGKWYIDLGLGGE